MNLNPGTFQTSHPTFSERFTEQWGSETQFCTNSEILSFLKNLGVFKFWSKSVEFYDFWNFRFSWKYLYFINNLLFLFWKIDFSWKIRFCVFIKKKNLEFWKVLKVTLVSGNLLIFHIFKILKNTNFLEILQFFHLFL